MSARTLQFPSELVEEVGLNVKEINSFKGKGCRFYGKKTCLQWVMDYLDSVTPVSEASPATEQPAGRQRSGGNKSGARVARHD